MKRTAAPPARKVSTTPNRRSTSTAESAAVGSSITITLASSDRAFAISTICCSAIDRPRAIRPGSSGTPSRLKISAAWAFIASVSIRRPARSGCRPMKMFSATVRSGNMIGSW